jgi:hypothetical protein
MMRDKLEKIIAVAKELGVREATGLATGSWDGADDVEEYLDSLERDFLLKFSPKEADKIAERPF